MAGRKTKLTVAVHQQICSYIATGAYKEHAAAAAGVPARTLHEWLSRGSGPDADEPYISFADDVRKAEGKDVVTTTAVITKAEKKDWKAAAWKLERKFPKQFGAKLNIQTEVQDGVMKVLEMARPHCDPEHYAGFVKALAVAADIEGVDPPGTDQDDSGSGEGESLKH